MRKKRDSHPPYVLHLYEHNFIIELLLPKVIQNRKIIDNAFVEKIILYIDAIEAKCAGLVLHLYFQNGG